MFTKTNEQHKIFDETNAKKLVEVFSTLKLVNPNETTLILTDHHVDNNFFWDLNSALIEVSKKFLPKNISNKPIIPLPLNSNDEEFMTLLSKMKGGTMLIDFNTFNELTFKSHNPLYFYSNRIVIHRTGQITVYAGRKF